MVYSSFDDLPTWLKERAKKIAGAKAEIWVNENIPALGNNTIVSVMNFEDGEARIRAYLQSIEGHFRL